MTSSAARAATFSTTSSATLMRPLTPVVVSGSSATSPAPLPSPRPVAPGDSSNPGSDSSSACAGAGKESGTWSGNACEDSAYSS